MAEISLRAYVQYVEDRLARDALQEVAAHCRHILEHYPKHVETYRLLGKTLLEGSNYQAASDIFQRVLSADPGDFWGHIGMSLVYQETGALDQAIWHLERAYEQAPNNRELQDELRKAIKARDGVEPHKVQLTRGALARLYANGRLYQQAIAEITEALQEDPERLDLQVLLAQVLWDSHQEIKAGKVAAEVLRKLPYCLQANCILADLWLNAGQLSEARPFIERVKALDPYLGYELEHEGRPAPSDAFRLLQFEWTPTTAAASADAPSWVRDLPVIEKAEGVTGPLSSKRASPPGREADAGPTPPTEGPDWLSEVMGTGGVLPTLESTSSTVPSEPVGERSEDQAPDWLKDVLGRRSGTRPIPPTEMEEPVSPDSAAPPDASRMPATLGTEDAPEWLGDILGEQAPQPDASLPPAAPDEDLPEWLDEAMAGEPDVQPAAPGGEDWLDAVLQGETPTVPTSAAPAREGTLPDWLEESVAPAAASSGQKHEDVVPGAPQEEEQVTVPSDKPSDEERPEEELPEWMVSGDLDSDEAMAWLEGLAARQGVSPDQLVTSPEERARAMAAPEEPEPEAEPEPEPAGEVEPPPLPDWLLEEADAAAEAEAVIAEAMAKSEEKPEEEREPAAAAAEVPEWAASGEIDGDEALAWLEGLAARQGASPDQLITAPEDRPQVPQEEKTEWLRTPTEELVPAAEVEEEEELPEWLSAAEPESVAEAPQPPEEGEAMDWLDGLVTEQGAPPETVITEALRADKPTPPPPLETEATPVSPAELPDWLLADERAREEMERAMAVPVPAEPEEEVPLAEVGEEDLAWLETTLEEAPAAAEDELEAWLQEISPEAAEGEREAREEEPEEVLEWLGAPGAPVAEEPVDAGLEAFLEEAVAPPVPAAEAPPPPPVVEVPPTPPPVAEVPPAPPPRPTVPPPPPRPPAAEAPPEPVVAPAEVPVAPPTKPTGLLPEYEQKLSAEPGDYPTRLALAREHMALGNHQEALDAYEVLISSGQLLDEVVGDLQDIVVGKRIREPRPHRLLGDALMAQGRLQEALSAYRNALDRF